MRFIIATALVIIPSVASSQAYCPDSCRANYNRDMGRCVSYMGDANRYAYCKSDAERAFSDCNGKCK